MQQSYLDLLISSRCSIKDHASWDSGHPLVIWLGSQQKLQRILKRHTLQLNPVGMKALLEALDKGAAPG